jgi:proton-dependent oligopeptide transporter, POT family
VSPSHRKEFFGHPIGLFVLFFTEMWERFSYYGMRSLLVFYMIKHLHFSQAGATQIYGLYTGLVYLTPLFGGIVADRWWGQRKTVIVGAVLMALGHFLMAWESLFFVALFFLILGNGAFKPNISTQVGGLYEAGDPRRDRAFGIFYMGVNLGALGSPLVCGTLGELYGWHYGFGAAGVGMVAGLLIYLSGERWLGPDTFVQSRQRGENAPADSTAQEKTRVWSLMALCLISVAFWAAYEQQGNTIALWADAQTDRFILGWEFPASWIQSLNPAFVLLLTPFVTTLWARQSGRDREPSAPAKMAIGSFLLAASFVVMTVAADLHAVHGTRVSVSWLIVFTLLATLGELYVSPVGLSLVTKLAPARMVSMMMGIWFTSSFFGNYAAGCLGLFWGTMPKDLFFLMVAIIAGMAGSAILLCIRPLRRAMGPEHPN